MDWMYQSRYLRLQDNTTGHTNTMFQTTRLTDVFSAPIGGSMTQCTMDLRENWVCGVRFMHLNTPYRDYIALGNPAFVDLMSRYISQTGDSQHGSVDPVACGVNATPTQREAFAKALARHFISCLDQIVTDQGTAVLSYAAWYNRHVSLDDASDGEAYSAAIQQTVCRFIECMEFGAGTASYTVTKWSPVTSA